MSKVELPLALYMCFEQVKAENEIFMCDFTSSVNDKIRAIFELTQK